MKRILRLIFLGITCCECAYGQTNSTPATDTNLPAVETIVCIRHGEKPRGGLGQLTCRGLNRALALPEVLLGKYGKPEFIFAPNPEHKVDKGDGKGGYYYVRPLTTIEPTAIRCGLPVNTEFGYDEIKGLETELGKSQYQNATIFIAWEHGLLDNFARNMVKDNGDDPQKVPGWSNDEYDMIFVFKITRDSGGQKFSFAVEHEGLNGLSDDCP